MDTFDYVIVGAGSAGSVLANRLSEDPDTSVCVLEAGPADRHPYIHLPAGFIKTFYNTSINWCYSQEPGQYTAGRRIFCRACLDWSERRYHVAGYVGAEICRRSVELGWVSQHRGTRAVQLTPKGRRGYRDTFGMTFD